MKEKEIEKQFKVLQQEIAVNGGELEALKRDYRAEIDSLRLEVKALRRCLALLHPDFVERLAVVRDQVIQETYPEAP
jgi:regulator of replication initiation timing